MSEFLNYLFAKHTQKLFLSIILLAIFGFLEVASIITFVPLIELLTIPNLVGASGITLNMLYLTNILGISFSLKNVMAILILFVVLKNFLLFLTQKMFIEIKYQLIQDLLYGTIKDFFSARWSFFISNYQGVLCNSILKEINTIGLGFTCISKLITNIFNIFICLIISIFISIKLSLFFIAIAIISVLPFISIGQIMNGLGRNAVEAGNRLFQTALEALNGAKLIIGYGQQSKTISYMKDSVFTNLNTNLKAEVLGNSVTLIYEPISFLIIILSIYIGINFFKIPIAELFVLLYCFKISLPLLAESICSRNKIANVLPSFIQVMHLKELARKQIQPPRIKYFETFRKEIIFKNVCFGYSANNKILYDINIKIPKGKVVAIVGESGAGKTTLIDLLMGFYEPDKGEIYVDGVPLKEIDIISWRKHLGYVPQESFLFNMSIRKNLLWSKNDATDEEIITSCKLSKADEFIQKLKDGYNTIIGDKGYYLSGGQRQRIALARAILRDPKLLILDEATNAIDGYSELLIHQTIENISIKTTIVLIAHRFSTIVKADLIYMLEKGNIVERGTYKELFNLKGKFYRLIQSQKILGD